MIIVWNTPYPVGGVTAFCVHLHLITGAPLARICGVNMQPKELGNWGVQYQNVTIDRLLSTTEPILLGGGSWTIDEDVWPLLLARPNVWVVLHDETEFKSMPHAKFIRASRVIVMREHNLEHYPTAVLLPQPYRQRYENIGATEYRAKHAVSTSRLDGNKGTEKIVLANRLVPKPLQVELLGSPNRLWVFGKQKKLPELMGLRGFPAKLGAGAEMHRLARLGVDMTEIGLDGGVQYTLLESIDAGSIPVVTHKFQVKGLRQHVASTPDELAAVLRSKSYNITWATENRRWLRAHHDPQAVARAWLTTVR